MSSHLEILYDKEDIIKYFGKRNPTLSERTEYWNDCWVKWRNNRLVIRNKTEIISNIRQMEISNFDFMFRGHEIRFRNMEDLLYVKLLISR